MDAITEQVVNKFFAFDIENYIFIYTPPKVGSTTLVSSLRISLGRDYNVVHIHDDTMLSVLTGVNEVTIDDIIKFLSKKGKNVYVIDIYRTPVERKMSEFFEKISSYHFNNSEENISKYKCDRVSDRFNKVFPYLAKGEHYFDKYKIQNPVPFDFNKKYTIQKINNTNYIKLRLCDSRLWGSILSEIFNKEIVIINDYQTETKEIGEFYKKFKNEYRLPVNYLDLIKECKYLNFYYSEQEKNNYFNEWNMKLSESCTPYTELEYKFYVNLYLENQYFNNIQMEHYIDNGCYCNLCCNKRNDIYTKAKNGDKITAKILHVELVNNNVQQKNTKIAEFIKKRNTIQKQISHSVKQKTKQFGINLGNA